MHPLSDPPPVPGPFVWRLGPDLVLLPRTPALLAAYHQLALRNQQRLARWEPWAGAGPRTEQDTRRYLEECQQGWGAGRQLPTAIAVPDPGGWRLVGSAGLRYEPTEGTGSVGYWLDAEFEGRGVMTRSVRALLDHAFSVLGLRQVELRTQPENVRSRAVAARLGFTEIRLERASLPFPDGARDDLVHRLTAASWVARDELSPRAPRTL